MFVKAKKNIIHLSIFKNIHIHIHRKWNIVNDQSNSNCDVGLKLCMTQVLKSNICDYSDTYILVRGDIFIVADNESWSLFKNFAAFTKSISASDGTRVDDGEDLTRLD